MDDPTINWYINNHAEGATSRVWNIILSTYFPLSEGYTTGPEMSITGNSTHLALSTTSCELKFLVVECVAPRFDTQSSVWEDGLNQLEDNLAAIFHRNRNRVFGVIAVGKVVKFYEWDRVGERAHGMAGGDALFYLDRQCKLKYLTYFRKHSYVEP